MYKTRALDKSCELTICENITFQLIITKIRLIKQLNSFQISSKKDEGQLKLKSRKHKDFTQAIIFLGLGYCFKCQIRV